MARRSYDQFCPVAKALDIVGDRWTLLVVRELLVGPRRFADLLEALPGLGTSLLASRLKRLEACGAIGRQRLPAPAGSNVYRLTESGRRLGRAVHALAAWGAGFLGAPQPGEQLRPELLGLYLAGWAGRGALAAVRGIYEVQLLDGGALHFRVADGGARAVPGRAEERPDLVLRLDKAAFAELCLGRARLRELIDRGRAEVAGSRRSLAQAVRLFDAAVNTT